MSTIEFRGKRLHDGLWVYGCPLVVDTEKRKVAMIVTLHDFYPDVLTKVTTSVDFNTLGQFTGLHDKNGKPIFEGDLIKHRNKIVRVQFYRGAFGYTNMVHVPMLGLKENYHLEFIPFYASDDNQDAFRFEDGTVFDTDYCEVIGNIHDNTELIEKGGES